MDSHKNRRRQIGETLRNKRSEARDALRSQRRAGVADPEVKENAAPALQKQNKAEQLRQQLEMWRQERQAKRLVEQRTQKPVFRVGRVKGDALQPTTLLPPVKNFRHITSRIDTGLKNFKPNFNFACTSKKPMIFTGQDAYLTSDEDAGPTEEQIEKPKALKKRPAASKPQSGDVGQKNAAKNRTTKAPQPSKTTISKAVTRPAAKPHTPAVEEIVKAPRSKKRAAPEEDLVTDDDDSMLGFTPSGKVRKTENGKPLPVIRKSFEILRLKTTEERVAALMNSPMVEFRRRRSGFTSDASSPTAGGTLSEEEQTRREQRAEMRAEVMQKVAADYAKSPETQLVTESPLTRLDPTSARKVRRKSRLLQGAFESAAEATGQPVTVLSGQHFRSLLCNETTRLEELRDHWEPLSFDVTIPSNAQAEIAAVIGQTELLFRHKFFFFEQMISKHENGTSGGRGALEGRLVTAEDLLGYWEVMHLEVDNLDARYANLKAWEAKQWSDLDPQKAAPEAKPSTRKIVKAKRVAKKKPVTSKFAEFRAQMRKKKNEEGPASSGEGIEANAPPSTPPPAPVTSAPLRSALKSGRRQSKAAVRFAASPAGEEKEKKIEEKEELCTPSPLPPTRTRRQLTPYREKRASSTKDTFVSPQRPLRQRTRSCSLHNMPASPRANTPTSSSAAASGSASNCSPASTEVAGRPKSGTPFPEPRSSSGSRRRIAELRSNAGLTLRTEEARRLSSSLSPPVRRAAGRTRQSSVRFNEAGDSPEEGHPTMPMTPYNRNSLVPMPRRSRASSAPRSKTNGASASSSSSTASSSASTSRVRFDSDTYSPPADAPSAPVTPFSKDSLVPLPRRQRQSSVPKRCEASDGATFTESVTPPLTPRLVDVTPLRRSARQRNANLPESPAGDQSLL